MTPAQLEHLRLIDAHLANLLDIAAKRTPGDWYIRNQQREIGQSGDFETETWISSSAGDCITNGWNLEEQDEGTLPSSPPAPVTPRPDGRPRGRRLLKFWPLTKLGLNLGAWFVRNSIKTPENSKTTPCLLGPKTSSPPSLSNTSSHESLPA